MIDWRKLNVKWEGLLGGEGRWPMWPKIVQVNKQDVYIISGNNTTPKTQNSSMQSSVTTVFKLDLKTWKVE